MAFLLWLPFAVRTLEGDYDKITQGSGLDMAAYENSNKEYIYNIYYFLALFHYMLYQKSLFI